jgi:hypothetical protein
LSAAPAKDLLSKPAIRESRPTVRHRPSTDSSSYPVGRITRKRRAVRVYWGDRNFPLCRSTIILQIASPNPIPRGLVVTNASKTTPALLGSMPGPVSSAVRTIASRFMRPVLAGHQQGYRGARTKIVDPKSNFFSPRGWDIRIPRLGVVIRDASRPHAVARQKHTRRLRQVRALKTSDTVSFA